ncbi:MAG: ATP-dependent Clp protease proteolytic subunit [Candidatus Dojkabacteria bacterium]
MSKIGYTYLFGETTMENIKEVVKAIDEFNQNKDITEINLVMNSWGGPLYPGFGLFDHIKDSKKPIDIIVEGTAMSCAVMILQAARKRFAKKHTIFMVHPSNFTTESKYSHKHFMSEAEQYNKDHELFISLSIDRSGIDPLEFEKIYEPQKYLTAEEALKFGKNGLIDEIM